jgi:hypothetical protein
MSIMTSKEKDKLFLNFEDKIDIYGDLDIIKKIQMEKKNDINEIKE